MVVLDARSGREIARLRVPSNPSAVTTGSGRLVWVTGMGENTLTRID